MSKINKIKITIELSEVHMDKLDFLCQYFGESTKIAVIRKLIDEKHKELK